METRSIPEQQGPTALQRPSFLLILVALIELCAFEWVSRVRGFRYLRQWAYSRVRTNSAFARTPVEQVTAALDLAHILYPRTIACLQRSVVLTRMFRRIGLSPQIVIGVQRLPLRSHAWVEVDGAVIGEPQRVRKSYRVLDRWDEK